MRALGNDYVSLSFLIFLGSSQDVLSDFVSVASFDSDSFSVLVALILVAKDEIRVFDRILYVFPVELNYKAGR
jgi:hypothetical protein